MAPSEIDFYKILGLGRHATDDDIKRSFRKLARDTHPDKNPGDPTAKERFQDLQHAYDTLRDNLERSKYDEDNPYHGLDHPPTHRPPNGSTATKSGTAKRYTAAASSTHTPGWANGTPRGGAGYDGGFPQQAAGSSSAKQKSWGYPYETWESGGKTSSGFPYQTGGGGYRPSRHTHPPHPPHHPHSHPPPHPPPPPHSPPPPPPPPPPAGEYHDESYAGYSTRHKRESAYARAGADRERAHPTTTKYKSHSSSASSSSPRPKSTSGTAPSPHAGTSARYAGAPTNSGATPAGFSVADYIREATEKEKRRQKVEEQKREHEQQLRREAEEQFRQDQQRKQEEQHQRRHEARERERRRAAEASRDPYSEINGFGFAGSSTTPTPRSYSYGFPPPDPSSPYTPTEKEEDLLKEADEKMKAKAGKHPLHHSHPNLSSHSRRRSKSSMKPKPEPSPSAKYSPMFGQGIPENTNGDRPPSARIDVDVVEATPTDRRPYSPHDYFSKLPNDGPGYIREDGTGVYPAPPLSFKVPVREKDRDKSTPTKPRGDRPSMPGSFEAAGDSPRSPPTSTKKQPKSPRHRPSGGGGAPESTSDKDNRPKPTFDVFEFQETTPPNPKAENPAFSQPPDFSFVGPNVRVGSFTSNNSPEPQAEKTSSSGSSAYLRPQAQPPFVPSPSAPPNMQQQQAAESANKANGNDNAGNGDCNGNGNGSGNGEPKKDDFFKRELYDNLLKQANPFKPQPSSTSATGSTARRKRSAPTLKKKQSLPIHRMAALGLGVGGSSSNKVPKLDGRPKAGSDVGADERRTTAQPPAGGERSFGYEPMDAEPTGPPKSMPAPQNPTPPPPPPPPAPPGGSSPISKGPSPLDNVNGMRSVPPLSRSPADVGLGDFEPLKDSLLFASSQTPKKSTLFARPNKLPSRAPSAAHDPFMVTIPPDFWNGYPQTPLDQPFVVPKPPPVPKIPRQTSLDQYNRFYNSLGSYIEAWNKYEAEVHTLRAELTSKSMNVSTTQTFDTQDIVKYMSRVKNRDTVLDNAFTKARDKHISALDMWVNLRENILNLKDHEQH